MGVHRLPHGWWFGWSSTPLTPQIPQQDGPGPHTHQGGGSQEEGGAQQLLAQLDEELHWGDPGDWPLLHEDLCF